MVNTAARLYLGEAPTLSTVLYTVPTATKTIVTEIIITNTTTAAIVISINVTAPPAPPALSILNDISVPANGVFQQGLKQVLLAGDKIEGISSVGTGVNIFISGVEIT